MNIPNNTTERTWDMRNIINDMAEKFTNGTIRTTAHDENGWEIGMVSMDIDTRIEHVAGGLQYTIKVTWYGAHVETTEFEYYLSGDAIIDHTMIDIDTEDTPPEPEIAWVRSEHR